MGAAPGTEAPQIETRREGPVAWIVLNRPERLNALVDTMRVDLHCALSDAFADPAVRVVVVTGAGRAFCAGADVGAMAALAKQEDGQSFAESLRVGMEIVREIRAASKPVIAAVNGPAAGAGASLALACDLRIASDAAMLGITFNRVGLHPDWGASYLLPRLVGAGRAAEMILSGRMVGAAEGERIGLFERVVPDPAFETEVREVAHGLAAKPPLAIAAAKRTLARVWDVDLGEVMEMEAAAQLRCFASADLREGLAAFLEKRAPVFRGR